MRTPIANLEDFAALDPFFHIIQEGLAGFVEADHFFDLLAEDIVTEYIVTVPDYPPRVEGRQALAKLYRPYGTRMTLERCFDLAVYHDAARGVVVLEYASGDTPSRRGTATATASYQCSRSATERSFTGGTISTRSPCSTHSAGQHADGHSERRDEPCIGSRSGIWHRRGQSRNARDPELSCFSPP